MVIKLHFSSYDIPSTSHHRGTDLTFINGSSEIQYKGETQFSHLILQKNQIKSSSINDFLFYSPHHCAGKAPTLNTLFFFKVKVIYCVVQGSVSLFCKILLDLAKFVCVSFPKLHKFRNAIRRFFNRIFETLKYMQVQNLQIKL